MGLLTALFVAVPWSSLLVHMDSSPLKAPISHSPSPARPAASRGKTTGSSPSEGQWRAPRGAAGESTERPGCQIADACLVVHGYLEELSEGQGGYGVLKLGKERLEAAAVIADEIGKEDLAESMREVCEKLPEVHTADAAAELAEEMEGIKKQAWRLGRACGLSH